MAGLVSAVGPGRAVGACERVGGSMMRQPGRYVIVYHLIKGVCG